MTRTLVRRFALLAVAGTAVATLAACGGSGDQSDSGSHGSMSGMPASSTAPPSASSSAAFDAADVMFAQMMIPHHQQAVTMAELAPARAGSGEVKNLAARIKAAQGPEITTMTGWLTAWGKPAPAASTGMSMDGHSMSSGMMSDADMNKLAAESGTAFDKDFLTMMTSHHQGAIDMARTELAEGQDSSAKALAQRIVTDQQAEIATMRQLLRRL